MKTNTILVLGTLALVLACQSQDLGEAPRSPVGSTFGVRTIDTIPSTSIRKRSPDVITQHYVAIRRNPQRSPQQDWLQSLRAGPDRDGHFALRSDQTKLVYHESHGYLANISIGTEELQVIMDTGSSDTWLLDQDVNC